MEFLKTKMFGGEVNILFTGQNYFFFHAFHGLLGIAERDDNVETSDANNSDQWHSKFTLYAGHRDYCYARECFDMMKRIIQKYDQKFTQKTFEFEEIETNLDKCLVSVSYDLNRFS